MMKLRQKSPTQTLLEERDRLTEELRTLQNKIRGLELAIELISDEAGKTSVAHQRTQGTTATIRQLLREAGPAGLTPQMAVELAARHGDALNKTSVSSLLSRMKRSGEVEYRKRRYILKDD